MSYFVTRLVARWSMDDAYFQGRSGINGGVE
jgi:hypothetical protein